MKKVHSDLEERSQVVHNTVQSSMERLFKKDLLSREKFAHAFVYTVKQNQQECLVQAVAEVLDHFGGSYPEPNLAVFVAITAKEGAEGLGELQRLITTRLENKSFH